MPRGKAKPKPEHLDLWACCLCPEPAPEMEGAQTFIDHCREHHPEVGAMEGDPPQFKVKARMQGAAFLDAREWYRNSYAVMQGETKIADRCLTGPRDDDDPMRY